MEFVKITNSSLTLQQLLSTRGIKIQIGEHKIIELTSGDRISIHPISIYVNCEGRIWVDDEYSFIMDEKGFCHITTTDKGAMEALRDFKKSEVDSVLIENNIVWFRVSGNYQKVALYSPLKSTLIDICVGEFGSSTDLKIFKQEE